MGALAGAACMEVPMGFLRGRHDLRSPYCGYLYEGRTPWNAREFSESQLDPAFCDGAEPATAEEVVEIRSAKAQEPNDANDPDVPWSVRHARYLAQQAMPTPQRYGRFVDAVSLWLESWPQITDWIEDANDRTDDEHEAEVGPIQAWRDAVENKNRSRYIARIFNLSGTYLGDAIDMTTSELWQLLDEIRSCLHGYHHASQ